MVMVFWPLACKIYHGPIGYFNQKSENFQCKYALNYLYENIYSIIAIEIQEDQ